LWSLNASAEYNYELIFDSLFTAVASAQMTPDTSQFNSPQDSCSRWNNLLAEGDHKKIWTSINWRGEWCANDSSTYPSNDKFCEHFESLYNPPEVQQDLLFDPLQPKYMPVLDDPI
jgi:hypothetical protein